MFKYYRVSPEVAGGLGVETIMDRSEHPPRVAKLHYEVIDWLGDSIVQSFPCYLVVRSLAQSMSSAGLSGFSIASAVISEASEFREFNPEGELPDLVWLIPDGVPGVHDVAVNEKGHLIASETFVSMINCAGFRHGSAKPWAQ